MSGLRSKRAGRLVLAAVLLAGIVGVSGCGKKGPLYLPEPGPKATGGEDLDKQPKKAK